MVHQAWYLMSLSLLNPFILVTFLPPKFCDVFPDIQGVPLSTEPGNEDIATKFEEEYFRCVRNEEECVCSVYL